jgi:hypothetical protein
LSPVMLLEKATHSGSMFTRPGHWGPEKTQLGIEMNNWHEDHVWIFISKQLCHT